MTKLGYTMEYKIETMARAYGRDLPLAWKTAVPSDRRLAAPAPVALTSGQMPRILLESLAVSCWPARHCSYCFWYCA